MPNPACVTYEAYRAYLKEHAGIDKPEWSTLHPVEQKAWWKVFLTATKITMSDVDLDAP